MLNRQFMSFTDTRVLSKKGRACPHVSPALSFGGRSAQARFWPSPGGGQAVADRERGPVDRLGTGLPSAPLAEEFSLEERPVVGAGGDGLGVGRETTPSISVQILRCPGGQEFAEFPFGKLTYDLSGPLEPAGFESANADCFLY